MNYFHVVTVSVVDWESLFKAAWRDFNPTIKHIKHNLERHRQLVDGSANLTQFLESQSLRNEENSKFERAAKDNEDERRRVVQEWLSPANCEIQQNHHRTKRSFCADAGRWLLEHVQFQKWFSPDKCATPLLWLSGIPGAGITGLSFRSRSGVLTIS